MPTNKVKRPDVKWDVIETEYRVSDKSINAIAKEHNIATNTVCQRAARYGWVRNNGDVRRAVVKKATNVADPALVNELMINSAQQYAKDMRMGLEISRNCLASLEAASQSETDPKIIKTITESTKSAIDTIRAIGGLDAPDTQPTVNIQINSEKVAMIMDKLQNEY